MSKQRPKHLDLLKIRLPLPGVVSILHRVSGAGLFLMLWFLLYLFQQSLASRDAFNSVARLVAQPWVKFAVIGLLWAYIHHFCAGLRFLALDLAWGIKLDQARATSKAVMAVSLALTLALGAWIW